MVPHSIMASDSQSRQHLQSLVLSLPRSHLFLLVLDHELDLIFFSFFLGDL